MALRYRIEPKQLKKRMSKYDVLLYSEIGHQVGLIRQLVETDAETQSQILV